VLIVLQLARVTTAFLNILIGKAGLFESTPIIGSPVARDLRSVQGLYEVSMNDRKSLILRVRLPWRQMLVFSLIDKVQGRAEDLKSEADRLGGVLQTAIDSYSDLA
jgi:hypothetical protein